MARSLIRQLEQIRRAAAYDDEVVGVNTSAVAEPTVSGSLEDDTNVIRTLLKQFKFGTTSGTNWYDSPGTYFDPTDTNSLSAENKELSLYNLKNNTLDAKTAIIAVVANNSGAGYTVSGTMDGVLLTNITTEYADHSDRRGIPIFKSVANNGSYHDEDGEDRVCRIDVLNSSTDAQFVTTSGYTVYAKFHDGADHLGSGEDNDAFAKFYANDVEIDMSSVSGTVSNVYFVYPQRKVLSEMEEYDWTRTKFVSSWEGDVELIEDIVNLWSYTGASDGVTDPTWTNTTASYILQSSPSDLTNAVDLINTEIGSRLYSENNYITDGEDLTTSIDGLDQAIKDIADDVAAGVGEKYVESVSSDIDKNTLYNLPYSISYTPESTSGREGKNLDIYVDGQLLAADTGSYGANADRDYGETTASGVTFRFDIQTGRNITYIVRQ
jgi:hypothetical protein